MISGKKIFLFINNEESNWVLREIFEANQMEVKTSSEINNLIHDIVEFEPDILLIEVQLGTYDGRTLCYHLKHTQQTAGIPIIMMSDNDDISLVDGVPCSADYIVSKPFVVKDLLNKINTLIN